MRLPIRPPAFLVATLIAAATIVPPPASADGPMPRSLLPSRASAEAESLAAARASADSAVAAADNGYRPSAPNPKARARRITIRRVALISGLGLTAVAIWRGVVANDREDDYDAAIFSTSAAELREKVRDAEGQRDLAAGLAGAAFSVAFLTVVF